PDWAPVFAAAGLEPGAFRRAEPTRYPPVAWDGRAAWVGAFPDQPELPLRLEAAWYRGKLVSWQTFGPWAPGSGTLGRTAVSSWVELGLVLALVATGGAFAARHIYRRRADLRGTWRLLLFLFAVSFLGWFFCADHTRSPGVELSLLQV